HEADRADERRPDREHAEQQPPDLEPDGPLSVPPAPRVQAAAELLAFGPAQHLTHAMQRRPCLVYEPPRGFGRLARRGAEQVAPHPADDAARQFDAVEARVVVEADALEQGGGAEEVDQLS